MFFKIKNKYPKWKVYIEIYQLRIFILILGYKISHKKIFRRKNQFLPYNCFFILKNLKFFFSLKKYKKIIFLYQFSPKN